MDTFQIKTLTVNDCRVVNAENTARQLDDYPDWMNGINQLHCPSGTDPGTGTFLVNREDFNQSFPESDAYNIVMARSKVGGSTTTLTLRGYFTLSAYAALRVPGSPMVVTVADARHVLGQAYTNNAWNTQGSSEKTWEDVLADVRSDLPTGYDGGLVFKNAIDGQYKPRNLRYEGWRTVDAIQDIANRTNHTLVYNPFDKQLEFQPMGGLQNGLSSIVNGAKLHRKFELPNVQSKKVGKVIVSFSSTDASRKPERLEKSNPAGGGNSQHAWGTQLPSGKMADLELERDKLAETWFNWSDRATSPEINEYFNALAVRCGSEVASVSWKVDRNELFTVISKHEPPKPETKRQIQSAANNVHVHFTAPEGGIPGGGTAPCTVISYSDGREVEENETKEIKNHREVRTCFLGDRSGIAMQVEPEEPEGGGKAPDEQWELIDGSNPTTIVEFVVPDDGYDLKPSETQSVKVTHTTDDTVAVGDMISVINGMRRTIMKGRSGVATRYLDGDNDPPVPPKWRVIEVGDEDVPDLVKFQTTETLYKCGHANAVIVESTPSIDTGAKDDCKEIRNIVVFDTTGQAIFEETVSAEPREFAGTGSMGFARPLQGTQEDSNSDDSGNEDPIHYEIVSLGMGECCREEPDPSESSESSSGSSDRSDSSSDSSESSSESSSDSSDSSSSDSSDSSDRSDSSDSTSSDSSESGSSSSSSSSSDSSGSSSSSSSDSDSDDLPECDLGAIVGLVAIDLNGNLCRIKTIDCREVFGSDSSQ